MSSALELDNIEPPFQEGNEQSAGATDTSWLSFPTKARIILAHEEAPSCDHSKTLFSQAGWPAQLQRCASLEDLQSVLNSGAWDLIITYANSHTFAPALLAKTIRSLDTSRQPALIFIADQHCPTNATEIMRCGFSDYLSNAEPERLVFSAAREVIAKQNQRIASTSKSVIAEAEAKSQLLLESTSDAIAYASDGMLIHVNQPLCQMLGFESPEDLELQPLIDLVAPDDLDSVKAIIKKMDANQQSDLEPTSVVLLTSGGEPVTITLSFASATHEGEACTQIMFGHSSAANVAGMVEPERSGPVAAESQVPKINESATTAPENISSSIRSGDLDRIASLQGKGLVGFLSTHNTGAIRKALGFTDYQRLGLDIAELLRPSLPENAIVSECSADSWLLAFSDEEGSVDATSLGSSLCKTVNDYLAKTTGLKDLAFCSLGIAKFGVADVDASTAMDKAFAQSAELQQLSGGYKVFAPRIDNAEGSAALKSALELDRLAIRYQPIIGLQNQSSQHYRGYIYIRNDAGQEIPARDLLANLGLESENVALDHWLVGQVIESLKTVVGDNPTTSVMLPLTASALVSDDFFEWLDSTVNASGIDPKHLAFELETSALCDYEQPASLLLSQLKSRGFPVSLSDMTADHIQFIGKLKPDFVKLSGDLTTRLNAAPELNSKEALKSLISEVASQEALCVATNVSTAAELAQLWQTGVPFVQGDYLQAPLSGINYEFSDIA